MMSCKALAAFSPAVSLVVTVHVLPLLALARRTVDLLGQLHQTDLLEVVLSEEPAAADSRRLGLPLLEGNTLKLLGLTQTQRALTLEQCAV